MKRNRDRGFSLAELGIALVIMLIIATIAMISFFVFIDDSKETRLVETAKTVQAASLLSYTKEGHFGTSENNLVDNVDSETYQKICKVIKNSYTDSSTGDFRITNSVNGLVLTEELIEDLDEGTLRTGLLEVSFDFSDLDDGDSGVVEDIPYSNREILEAGVSSAGLEGLISIDDLESYLNEVDKIFIEVDKKYNLGIKGFYSSIVYAFINVDSNEKDTIQEFIDEASLLMAVEYDNSTLSEQYPVDFIVGVLLTGAEELGLIVVTPMNVASSIDNSKTFSTLSTLEENPCYFIDNGNLVIKEADFNQLNKYLSSEVTESDIEGFYIVEVKGQVFEESPPPVEEPSPL